MFCCPLFYSAMKGYSYLYGEQQTYYVTVNVYYVNVCNMTSAFYKYPVFQELNGDAPDEREAAELKEQMWPKNTTNVKAMFEAKNEEDTTVKETPKQIDLQAEINGMCCITYVHVCHRILHVHVCHLVLYRFDKC